MFTKKSVPGMTLKGLFIIFPLFLKGQYNTPCLMCGRFYTPSVAFGDTSLGEIVRDCGAPSVSGADTSLGEGGYGVCGRLYAPSVSGADSSLREGACKVGDFIALSVCNVGVTGSTQEAEVQDLHIAQYPWQGEPA